MTRSRWYDLLVHLLLALAIIIGGVATTRYERDDVRRWKAQYELDRALACHAGATSACPPVRRP